MGLDNAGKTSILEALTGGCPRETSPTSGYNIKQTQINGLDFDVFDLGGQQSLRPRWADYYDKVAGIVWVIDSADRRRMYETGLELAAVVSDKNLDGVPILIMANKQDLATAMSPDEIAVELKLISTRKHTYQIQECVAIDSDDLGIERGMKWMTEILTPKSKAELQAERNLRKQEERQKKLAEKEKARSEKMALNYSHKLSG